MTYNSTTSWSAHLSPYQRSTQFTSLSDVSYSPRYKSPLVPERHDLSDRARSAKRRKIVSLAKEVVDGQPLVLQSMLGESQGIYDSVKEHLKARGEPSVMKSGTRSYSTAWLDVEDHESILKRINEDELSTEVLKQTTRTKKMTIKKNARAFAAASIGHHREQHSTSAQQTLTMSFKRSKAILTSSDELGYDKIAAPEVETVRFEGINAIQARVREIPIGKDESSPFLFKKRAHRTKAAEMISGAPPTMPTAVPISLVQMHINRTLPVSPGTGRASFVLRKSILQEMQDEGADILPASSSLPVHHIDALDETIEATSETSLPLVNLMVDTQAMIAEAQNALRSSPESRSSPLRSRAEINLRGPSDALEKSAKGRRYTNTQAMLNDWTPWSAKEQSHAAKVIYTSADDLVLDDRSYEDSDLEDSLIVRKHDLSDEKIGSSFAPEGSSELPYHHSSFRAAQLQYTVHGEDAIDDDITGIAAGLMA